MNDDSNNENAEPLGRLSLIDEDETVSALIYDADELRSFKLLVNELAKPEPPPTLESSQTRAARWSAKAEAVEKLRITKFARLAELHDRDLETIAALVDVMELGDCRLDGGNWMLSVIKDMMLEVAMEGAGSAISAGPATTLRTLARAFYQFSGWIEDARDLLGAYPQIFQELTPPAVAPAKAKPAAKPAAKRHTRAKRAA